MQIETFLFYDSENDWYDPNAFIATLPVGISSPNDVFTTYFTTFQLPAYFGYNWDALDECLRDLSWIDLTKIIIVHKELPGLNAHDLKLYLELLADIVKDWKSTNEHDVVVAFPSNCKEQIRAEKGTF